jgi:RNA polymerase sigma factor (sigma-70 family)
MKDSEFHKFLTSERQRFLNYVRSRLIQTAEMDAEDIVQDVLIKLLERSSSIAPLDDVVAYVFQSLRNRMTDVARTQKPNVSLDDDARGLLDLLTDLHPNALEQLQSEQGKQQLFKALELLSEVERKVVVAHEFEGISFKQMEVDWNIPKNTLLSHKSRALKKLKAHFRNL